MKLILERWNHFINEQKEDALAEAHPMSAEAKEAVLEDLDESALRDAVRDILEEMNKDN